MLLKFLVSSVRAYSWHTAPSQTDSVKFWVKNGGTMTEGTEMLYVGERNKPKLTREPGSQEGKTWGWAGAEGERSAQQDAMSGAQGRPVLRGDGKDSTTWLLLYFNFPAEENDSQTWHSRTSISQWLFHTRAPGLPAVEGCLHPFGRFQVQARVRDLLQLWELPPEITGLWAIKSWQQRVRGWWRHTNAVLICKGKEDRSRGIKSVAGLLVRQFVSVQRRKWGRKP